MWSKNYDKCQKCGTVEVPHAAKGFCKNCYSSTVIKEQTREYYKGYWKRNPDKYERLKQMVKDRHKTEAGKETLKKAHLRFLEKKPNYYKDYCKQYRQDRKKAGLCARCDTPICPQSKVLCLVHLEQARAAYKKKKECQPPINASC